MPYRVAAGIVISTTGTFSVTGGPSSSQPNLKVSKRSPAAVTEVAYNTSTGAWTTTLNAGDYLVTLEVADPTAIAELAINAPQGSIFAYYGPKSGDKVVAWATDHGVTQGDPKDPWPPPQSPEVQLAAETTAWFDIQLPQIDASLPKSYEVDPAKLR